MDKLARKHSPDPKQEELRNHKDRWNSETSDLIGDLIALKRGINGRGDKERNLPPSSIKEAFPPQIGSFLQDLSSSAAKIIQEARSIVQEQENYAKNRRRRRKLSHQERELIKLANLVSEASWWGSRMFSKYVSLRNMPVIQRNNIIDMMYSLADIKDKLKSFEDNLLQPDKKGIAICFTNLNSVLQDYSSNVLKPAKKLQQIMFEDAGEEFNDETSDEGPRRSKDTKSDMADSQKKIEDQKRRSKIQEILTNDFRYLEQLKNYLLLPSGKDYFFYWLDNN